MLPQNNQLNGLPANELFPEDFVWGSIIWRRTLEKTNGIARLPRFDIQNYDSCRAASCRTSMQPCRIFAERPRKSCERFWWADFGSKRCLSHKWIWWTFADDMRIDENLVENLDELEWFHMISTTFRSLKNDIDPLTMDHLCLLPGRECICRFHSTRT